MTSTSPQTPGHPVPTTISAIAQAVLTAGGGPSPIPDPPKDDVATWQFIAGIAASEDPATVEAVALVTTAGVITGVDATTESHEVDGARYFVSVPDGVDPSDSRVLLFIHGGGFTFGGGATARRSTQIIAGAYGVTTYGIDYRQLPEAPFPAGLDDVMSVYRELLTQHQPRDIAVAGQSGGANLSAALLLRASDEGLPLPVAVALISPPVDLTEAGDTYQTNRFTIGSGGLTNLAEFYRGDHPLDHPYLSPLFGEWTAQFPPVILTSGTRDFLLSDTVRLHRAMLSAGVAAELHVWEGAPHGMFGGRAPEDHEQVAQVRTFLEKAWDAAPVDA